MEDETGRSGRALGRIGNYEADVRGGGLLFVRRDWGCCRLCFGGEVDGYVPVESWLLLLLLYVDVVCVCSRSNDLGALRDRGFAQGTGVKVGGMSGQGTYAETCLTILKVLFLPWWDGASVE